MPHILQSIYRIYHLDGQVTILNNVVNPNKNPRVSAIVQDGHQSSVGEHSAKYPVDHLNAEYEEVEL
jgi:hypothetical protein